MVHFICSNTGSAPIISMAVIALQSLFRTNVTAIVIVILAPPLLRDTIHLLVK